MFDIQRIPIAYLDSLVFRLRLQIRVQDKTGTIALSFFNDEVLAVDGLSAYQLVDKYGKV